MPTLEPGRAHYLIDTSSLVEIEQRDAPADARDEAWRTIIELLEQGRLRLLDIVLDELDRNAGDEYFDRVIDRLRSWRRVPAKLRTKGDLTLMEMQYLADIISQFPKMSSAGKRGDRADPYLVCLGLAGGYVVVTEESPIAKDRIPAACRRFGVECIDLKTLIAREGLGQRAP